MHKREFDALVKLFYSARDRDGEKLQMDYFAVKQENTFMYHRFPGGRNLSDIRSISKTVLALVLGIVVGENPELTENTRVWPVLSRCAHLSRESNRSYLEQLQVKHLLNHTVGFSKVLMMRQDVARVSDDNYVEHVINNPITYPPGTFYLYSNAGFYLLSAFLQELLGKDLLTYAHEKFFKPLGINHYEWQKYGKHLAGATRLWLGPRDLTRIGELLLNHGERLVDAKWIERMKQFTEFTPHADTITNPYFRRWAYGSSLWLSPKNGIFFGHGTDGQSLVVVPDRNAVIVTTARQHDVTRLEELVDKTIELLY